MKQWTMIFLVTMLGACSSLLPVKTFDDGFVVANTTLSAVNTVADRALVSKAITKATASDILVKTVKAGRLLDEAMKIKRTGDSVLANIRLGDAKAILGDVKSILALAGVDVSSITL